MSKTRNYESDRPQPPKRNSSFNTFANKLTSSSKNLINALPRGSRDRSRAETGTENTKDDSRSKKAHKKKSKRLENINDSVASVQRHGLFTPPDESKDPLERLPLQELPVNAPIAQRVETEKVKDERLKSLLKDLLKEQLAELRENIREDFDKDLKSFKEEIEKSLGESSRGKRRKEEKENKLKHTQRPVTPVSRSKVSQKITGPEIGSHNSNTISDSETTNWSPDEKDAKKEYRKYDERTRTSGYAEADVVMTPSKATHRYWQKIQNEGVRLDCQEPLKRVTIKGKDMSKKQENFFMEHLLKTIKNPTANGKDEAEAFKKWMWNKESETSREDFLEPHWQSYFFDGEGSFFHRIFCGAGITPVSNGGIHSPFAIAQNKYLTTRFISRKLVTNYFKPDGIIGFHAPELLDDLKNVDWFIRPINGARLCMPFLACDLKRNKDTGTAHLTVQSQIAVSMMSICEYYHHLEREAEYPRKNRRGDHRIPAIGISNVGPVFQVWLMQRYICRTEQKVVYDMSSMWTGDILVPENMAVLLSVLQNVRDYMQPMYARYFVRCIEMIRKLEHCRNDNLLAYIKLKTPEVDRTKDFLEGSPTANESSQSDTPIKGGKPQALREWRGTSARSRGASKGEVALSVERIIHRYFDNGAKPEVEKFFIKWKGQPISKATWKSAEEIAKEFEKREWKRLLGEFKATHDSKAGWESTSSKVSASVPRALANEDPFVTQDYKGSSKKKKARKSRSWSSSARSSISDADESYPDSDTSTRLRVSKIRTQGQ